MKRSMTPLHCGSPTYDGVIVIPSHFTSLNPFDVVDNAHRCVRRIIKSANRPISAICRAATTTIAEATPT
jgi:hypothetical protein